MKTDLPLALLGGLSPEQFMKRHWQKKPLLIRQAIPGLSPLLSRSELIDMAERDDVLSRLVQRKEGGKWAISHGPFSRRALPAFKTPNWTVLIQSVDLFHQGVRELMDQFRFIPDARLDDLMISYATDGGGVGPHFDSYDVFLMQVQGTRRWRIGRQKDLRLQEGLPLKVLASFEPEQTFDLVPGDMLYLPPKYAHDGIAIGECMTYSVGFRAPNPTELVGQLLTRMADICQDSMQSDKLFADPQRPATAEPARLPQDLLDFAVHAVEKAMGDKKELRRVLGEFLTEPNASLWFDESGAWPKHPIRIRLDRKTKMLYAGQELFINGESLAGSGSDLKLMQRLADRRVLEREDLANASTQVLTQMREWCDLGWIQVD
jgi:50S ribosomal protein L16 3-hydroxylase